MAEYFAAGQSFEASASYLVPEQLRVAVTSISQRVLIYTDLDEIPLLVEEIAPDVVLLFSGYLYMADRLFSLQPWPAELAALKRLIDSLRDSGRPFATSDPFCGLTDRMKPWTFRLSSNGLLVGNWRQRLVVPLRSISIWLHFRRLHTLLKSLPHIYPGRVPESPTTHPTMAFFNQAAWAKASEWRDVARDDTSNRAPVWLFVISLVDLIIQRNTLGQDFAVVVSNRLSDAHQQGRIPILIAPSELLDDVRPLLDLGFDVEMHETLPYSDFMATLMNCEYAFYWNIFSSSTLLRIFLGRPVFFFDRGHLPRLVCGYYEEAVRCYLGGAEPQVLDSTSVLSADVLESLDKHFRNYSTSVVKHLAKSPNPSRVVAKLIAGSTPRS